VQSTPTIFINGRAINGAQPYEAIAAIVDEELDRGR
jgi:protein-disulfide isomerase